MTERTITLKKKKKFEVNNDGMYTYGVVPLDNDEKLSVFRWKMT